MKRNLILFTLLVSSLFGMNWDEIFDRYQMLLPQDTILREQYRAHVASNIPTNSDPRIKGIPIHESGEELIDLKMASHPRIQMLPDPNFPFESPCCNSGLPAAPKIRAGLFEKLQQMIETLDNLASGFGYEPGQVSIKAFEGLRNLAAQQGLYDKKLIEITMAYPHLTPAEAELETLKWVSMGKNVPVHSTGAAIDIRLWDEGKGDFLDLGSFGVIWGENREAETFSEGLSDEQKRNRLYCLIAAEMAGLTNYPYEFWHFSSNDRCAAYWSKMEPKWTPYGSIE